MRIAIVLLAALPLIAQGPFQLSLKRAVEIAASPEGNTNIQLSGEAVKQAEARSAQARASLLPDLSGSIARAQSDGESRRPGHRVQRADSRISLSPAGRAVHDHGCPGECDADGLRLRVDPAAPGIQGGRHGGQSECRTLRTRWRRRWRGPISRREGRRRLWKRRRPTSRSPGGREAGGESEGGRHGHGHRDHARQGAARQRPAAAAGRRRTRAGRRICDCCARWACGSTPK